MSSNLELRFVDGPCFDDFESSNSVKYARYIRVFTTREGRSGINNNATLVIDSVKHDIDRFLVKGRVVKLSGIPSNINPNLVTRGKIEVEFGDEEVVPSIAKNPGELDFRVTNIGPFLMTGNSTKGYGFHLYEHASAITSKKVVFRNLLLFSNNSYDIVEYLSNSAPVMELSCEAYYINDIQSDMNRIHLSREGVTSCIFTPFDSNVSTSGNLNSRFFPLVPPKVEDISVNHIDSSSLSVTWKRKNRCYSEWTNYSDIPPDDNIELYRVVLYDKDDRIVKDFTTTRTSIVVSSDSLNQIGSVVHHPNSGFESGLAYWYHDNLYGVHYSVFSYDDFPNCPVIEGSRFLHIRLVHSNVFSLRTFISAQNGKPDDCYIVKIHVGYRNGDVRGGSAKITLKGKWIRNGVVYRTDAGNSVILNASNDSEFVIHQLSARFGPRNTSGDSSLMISISGKNTGNSFAFEDFLVDDLQISLINTVELLRPPLKIEIARETTSPVTTRIVARENIS